MPDSDDGRTVVPGPAGVAKPRRPHRWRRVFAIVGVVLAVLVVAGGVAGYLIYRNLDGNITRVDVFTSDIVGSNRPTKLVESGAPQQPLNILVMGSDTRQGQGKGFGDAGVLTGARSDTTLLVHIPADRSRLLVVSIPRDTIVDLPSCKTDTGQSAPYRDRFNAAFSIGGPGCTIKTVEQNTGVFIDHYVVVDFRGFEDMINALGKIRVCLPQPVNDPKSRLNLPAGYSEVNGAQALAYVRTRYAIGNGSDISRISRQQAFLSSVIDKATSAGTLLNPAKLLAFLRAATKSITTDPQLGSLNQMRVLAQQMRSVPPSKITFVTTPWIVNPDDPNTVLWDPNKIGALWDAIKKDDVYPPPQPPTTVIDGRPLTTAPTGIAVSVLNGSGRPGAAGRLATRLTAKGYNIATVDNAPTSDYLSTVIRYDPAYANDAARTLAAALPGASREEVPGLGTVLEVITGRQPVGAVQDVVVRQPKDPNENIRTATENICSTS